MEAKYDSVSDDTFTQFLKAQQEAEAAKNAKSGGSGFTGEYEQVKYCAAPKEGHAIVRFVGNPPKENGSSYRPTDCLERCISKIKDDQGKIMYLILPPKEDMLEASHFMWRVIAAVKKREYISGKPVYVNEVNHPDIWAIVSKGGFKSEDGFSYTYANGWDARRMLLINCIDRADNWCKENKHTKVFSKNISISSAGAEFADMGVNSYGFLNKLIDNGSTYGSWEKYDSYVMRIGQKTEPFRILNASAYKKSNMKTELKGITETEFAAISLEDSLTDEEKSYERYDLEKHFKVSSYQKLLKRLGNSIKKIDTALGTHFYDELIALAAKEKEEMAFDKEAKAQAEEQNKIVEAQSTPVAPTPAPEATSFDTMASTPVQPVQEVRREVAPEAPAVEETNDEAFSLLAHFNDLSGAEKSLFRSVVMGADNVPVATFSEIAPASLPCPKCGFSEPGSVTVCANCGAKFAQ